MKYTCVVISVKDIKSATKFYKDLFGLKIVSDYGINVAFDCGIALQQNFDWLISIDQAKVISKSNNIELCFEEDDFDQFLITLKNYNVQYLGNVIKYTWGQRVIRFYDLDHHLIEVGENMKRVVLRFFNQGLTMDEIALKMDVKLSDLDNILAD